MPATPPLRSPLTIHVVWHPKFKEGDAYARFLYGMLTRDPADPFDRGMGIPVFFRSVPTVTGLPLPINLAEADRNVIVLFLDDELVVKGGEAWEQYVVKILADCRAHGPLKSTTTCQLMMRNFKDGDTIFVEPFRAGAFPGFPHTWVTRKRWKLVASSVDSKSRSMTTKFRLSTGRCTR